MTQGLTRCVFLHLRSAGKKMKQKRTLITGMTMSCISFVLNPIECFGEEIQRHYMGSSAKQLECETVPENK